MTKRALSLLLTLVMVLSLCVPALAAEDFEAEAPAEVVEEAPEAPEAPVAPEAEEPADEPVVDEPAAEEPVEAAEDAPEMASVMPEDAEDLPYLVALGVIDKVSHYKLEKALEVADAMKEKVDAEEVYGQGEWTSIGQSTSRTATFDKAYAEAKRCMDGINGLPITGDVSDSGVKKAATTLLGLIKKADGGTQTATTGLLTDDLAAVKAAVSGSSIKTYLTSTLLTGTNCKSAYKGMSDPNAAPLTDGVATAFADTKYAKMSKQVAKKWTAYYQQDYVDAVVKALDAFAALDENSVYADYAAAVKLLRDAAELEPAASRPTSANATALSDAIAATKAAYKDYTDLASNKNVQDAEAAKWANSITTVYGNISGAQGIMDVTTANGFKATTTYYNYTTQLKAVTLVANTTTVAVAKQILKMSSDNKKVGSVQIVLSKDDTKDSKNYAVAFSVNGVFAEDPLTSTNTKTTTDSATAIKELTGNWASNEEYGDLVYKSFTVHPLNKDNNTVAAPANFADDDVVMVYVYEVLSTGDIGEQVVPYQVTLTGDYYNGPVINDEKATVTFNNGQDTVAAYTALGTAISATGGNEVTIEVTPDEGFQTGDYIAADSNNPYVVTASVRDASDKNIAMVGLKTVTPGTTATKMTIKVGSDVDSKLTVGKMDVVMSVMTESGEGPVEHAGGRAQVTIEPLTKYTSGMSFLKNVVKDAKKLQKGDYKLNTAGSGLYADYDAAWTALQNFISAADKLITDAPGMANTLTNRKTLITTVKNVQTTFGYITLATPNKGEFNATLLEAMKIKDDDYSYRTWGALQVAIEDYKGLDSNLQSKYDEAVAELKAAIAALGKAEEVEKSTLEAAITAAEALKEADYTAESWKAADLATAISNAKAVLNNEKATQAMVNTAMEGLRTAQAKLVRVTPEEPEGPKAPTTNNGTGWVLDNGTWYFFKNSKLVANYWVGKIDGASQWDSNWYYVGADGKMLTGMQYIDDLHGGYGWYFLQPTDTKGEIGKMLTGYQWVGGQYGECYFSTKSGSSGKCTWSELLGNWNGTTWVK